MIVMDLEWNRSYDKKELHEILQIGAVRLEEPGGPIRDTFNAFIRPRVHRRFDPGARKLPDLQNSVCSDISFAEAWTAFLDWCGEDRVFAFWGPDDFPVIRQNCAYWKLPCITPVRVFNYQLAFAHLLGAGDATMALWRVVDYLGIPAVYEFHNALYDAVYTACAGMWLREEDLTYELPEKKKRSLRRLRFSRCARQAGEERAAGPFSSPEEALGSVLCRTPACPACSRQAQINHWYTDDEKRFYARALCLSHGYFPCLLRLAEEGDGFHGQLSVPAAEDDLLQGFRSAIEGREIACPRLPRLQIKDPPARRKKRRRKRRAGKKKPETAKKHEQND